MEALRVVHGGLDLDRVNAALAGATAEDVMAWAAEAFADGLVMSTSFGAHSAVMLHLLHRAAPRTPVVFVDTGYLFPETYRFAEALRERFRLNLHVVQPTMTAARQEALYGRLWEQGEEGVARYLELNKVEPMRRALAALRTEAWMAGLRREQTHHRARLRRVVVQDGLVKIHPILEWTADDVSGYMTRYALPAHPLVAEGYRSIGDHHSTLPTTDDMDPREGRVLGRRRECGLHLSAEQAASLKSSGL